MDSILYQIKKIIPESVFNALAPAYHLSLAFLAALVYRFPANHIHVVAITGTKGKSSTTEILNAVLEAAGKKTALSNTIRFKIGDESRRNLYKMTMLGRLKLQRFLRQAVDAKCEYAIIEMSSQGASQYRHLWTALNGLIFLNLSPEHIESHGGYENYVAAKLKLATALGRSPKTNKVLVVNTDDKESQKFVDAAGKNIDVKWFSLIDAEPYILDHYGLYLTFAGKNMRANQQGLFNVYNILAALTYAVTQNVTPEEMQVGLESLSVIPGRVQKITLPTDHPAAVKQNFAVIVDYAHTADSLEKVYSTFKDSRKICVLGNTGGGRDTWKRPEMGKVANDNCSHIILTNEDPYDEDPRDIIRDMLPGITATPFEIIIDRREAIRKAISMAKKDDTVIITGKGTDPYIMGPNDTKIPWSDAEVAKEELEEVLKK